jgi:hypothetical protein
MIRRIIHNSARGKIATSSSIKTMKIQKNFFCVVATATATLSPSTQAWVLKTTPNPSHGISSLPRQHSHFPDPPATTTRLYFSSPLRKRDNNNPKDNEGGFLSKIGNAVKSVLPTKLFGSEEEKAALSRKKQVKDQIKGNVDEMLKDAPLGIRMMGKMISPIVGNLASTLAEGMAEQQKTTESVMEEVRQYLMSDIDVTDALGAPIQIGAPFSQASSTSSINGQTQTRLELAMNISGPKRTGIARVLATESGVAQLIVEAGGKIFNVNLSSKGLSAGSFRSGGKSRSKGRDDNVIEAEIIDKETRQ